MSDTHIDVCEGGHSPEERRAFAEILSRIGDKWTVLVVGVLAAAGSLNPTVIIGTSIVATFVGTLAAVVTAKLLQRFYTQAPVAPAEARS